MKGLAIASFTLGIIGFLFSFAFGIGLIPSILAVILGIVPLIGKGKTGKPMAITGIILGTLGGLISYGWIEIGKEFVKYPEKTIEEVREKTLETPSKKPVQKKIPLRKPKVIIKDYNLDIADVRLEEIYIERFDLTLVNKGSAAADIDKIVFSSRSDEIEKDFYNLLTLAPNEKKAVSLISYRRKFKRHIGIDSITGNISVIRPDGKSLLEKTITIPISKIKIGDTIELKYGNNFSMTLISWKESKIAVMEQSENEYYTFTAKTAMKFIILVYQCKNNWIREQTTPYFSVGEIVSDKGYIYKNISGGVRSSEIASHNPREATQREVKNLIGDSGSYEHLLPEESVKGRIVFEIPEDQKPIEATIAYLPLPIKF